MKHFAILAVLVSLFSVSAQATEFVEHEGFLVPLYRVNHIPSDCGEHITQRVEYKMVCQHGRECKVPCRIFRTPDYVPTCSPGCCKPCCAPKPCVQPVRHCPPKQVYCDDPCLNLCNLDCCDIVGFPFRVADEVTSRGFCAGEQIACGTVRGVGAVGSGLVQGGKEFLGGIGGALCCFNPCR